MRRERKLLLERYLASQLRCEICNWPTLGVSAVLYDTPILFCPRCREEAEKDKAQKQRRHEFFRHLYSLEV